MIPVIDKDMVANEIFPIYLRCSNPVAVVENNKLLGVVIRGSVIEALAETEVNEQ